VHINPLEAFSISREQLGKKWGIFTLSMGRAYNKDFYWRSAMHLIISETRTVEVEKQSPKIIFCRAS
jgi:hypothetical protein